MYNRRDQVSAHGFMVGRLTAALLRAEPDLPVPPLRRSWSGMIIGAILAAVAVAGFIVFGMVYPGGASAWRKPGTLIVEKGTGTRFVFADGRLRPVLNYASARLLLGAKLKVDTVPSSSIDDVPRDRPVGIQGAPDQLPHAGGTVSPWLVCATSARAGNGFRPALALTIGVDPAVRPLSDAQALVVRTPDGTTFLVTGGRRLRVTAPWVLRTLGFTDDAAVGVREGWVNALPAGPDLPQPGVSGGGQPGPVLDGRPTRVGEVFAVGGVNAERRLYVLTADGLQPLTRTAAALALSDPKTVRAYDGETPTVRDLSPAALAATHVLSAPAWEAQVPAGPPANGLAGGRMPCVRVVPEGGQARTSVVTLPAAPVTETTPANAVVGPSVNATPGAGGDPLGAGQDAGTAARVADQVRVMPRAGLLARTLPVLGMPGEGLYLVTEDGSKFPVANETAASALGYAVSSEVPVPADLLALLPTGPVLDMLSAGGGGG
ncbi:type VII secretion protein EccB [Actinoallomurus sp. NPDC050550]|uniref:type VII secretion protein EccB n=1 Tax=Actinoallomurus sp. NPDC050550 TaxID=3154937 RepID=UPI0033F4599A